MAAVPFLFLLIFLSSSPHLSLSLSEEEALIKLKKSLTNANALDNWKPNPNSSPCQAKWAGIVCNKGVASGLNFANMGLSGKIDTVALKDIPALRNINLINNNFSGPIPKFSGALKSLLLNGNEFSGEIPKDFFSQLTSLKKIYFNDNNFTGKIPESLTQVGKLEELHLEKNRFTGPIPDLKQELKSIDLSKNKLQGSIPKSLSKFDPKAFQGNENLCGVPLKSSCNSPPPSPTPSTPPAASPPLTTAMTSFDEADPKKSKTIIIIVSVIVSVMFLLLLYVLLAARRRKREDDFDVLGKERIMDQHDQVVEVHVPSTNNRGSANDVTTSRSVDLNQSNSNSNSNRSKRGGADSKKGSNQGKNGMSSNDLLMVNDERGSFGLPDLMKAAAEVLGNGGLGSAYKAVMAAIGLSVVVKRMREMNRLGRDGFDAEMRRFGRLRHKNILTPLAYHYRREEKLLISEYIPKGSLLYVLHGDRGTSHSELNWPIRVKIIRGIACGMGFIHTEFASYDLPHGNLKSSNILLKEDYEPVLNDYAFHPLINPSNAAQAMFAFKTPEFTESQQISPKSDVYCLGIVILEILTGKFPSQYLTNGKGGTDVVQWVQSARPDQREQELIDPEIASDTNSMAQMLQLLQIGADCTVSDPVQRIDIREAISRIEAVQV